MARDAPVIKTARLITPLSTNVPFVTRNEQALKRVESTPKRVSDSERKIIRKPATKKARKPVTVSGYHWRKNGAGWDLRKDSYVISEDGVRKRKQPYVAHLSQEAFQAIKRQYKGASFEKAIVQWINDHDR